MTDCHWFSQWGIMFTCFRACSGSQGVALLLSFSALRFTGFGLTQSYQHFCLVVRSTCPIVLPLIRKFTSHNVVLNTQCNVVTFFFFWVMEWLQFVCFFFPLWRIFVRTNSSVTLHSRLPAQISMSAVRRVCGLVKGMETTLRPLLSFPWTTLV